MQNNFITDKGLFNFKTDKKTHFVFHLKILYFRRIDYKAIVIRINFTIGLNTQHKCQIIIEYSSQD